MEQVAISNRQVFGLNPNQPQPEPWIAVVWAASFVLNASKEPNVVSIALHSSSIKTHQFISDKIKCFYIFLEKIVTSNLQLKLNRMRMTICKNHFLKCFKCYLLLIR